KSCHLIINGTVEMTNPESRESQIPILTKLAATKPIVGISPLKAKNIRTANPKTIRVADRKLAGFTVATEENPMTVRQPTPPIKAKAELTGARDGHLGPPRPTVTGRKTVPKRLIITMSKTTD